MRQLWLPPAFLCRHRRSPRKGNVVLGHLYEERNWHLMAQLISLQTAEAWRLLSGNFVVGAVTCF